MQKDTLLSIFRAVLSLVGTYIVGHTLAGHKIDDNLWQLIGGAAITVASTIWGVLEKPTTIEAIQSALRSIMPAVGGVLLALGVTSQQSLDAFLSMMLLIVPIIQSHTSKVKVKQLDSGKITTTDKGKVVPATPLPK